MMSTDGPRPWLEEVAEMISFRGSNGIFRETLSYSPV